MKGTLVIILLVIVVFGPVNAQITYKPDGLEVAQPYFEKGLLLLHNFQFDEAAKQFQMAQLLDPDMFMAYWGETLCYDQGIWYRHNVEKSRGVLFKLGVSKDKRLAKIENDLERGFLNSVELLFQEEGEYVQRHQLYQQALVELYDQYPDNNEVACFLALSYLTLFPHTQKNDDIERAYELLQSVLEKAPLHPGALNYMIHASDHPNRAYRARRAAEKYPAIDPASYYNEHVASHHYLALGQWKDFTLANAKAWEKEEAFAKKKNINLENIGYHAYWWLLYGTLQMGQYNKAAEIVKNINFYTKYSRSTAIRYHLAMMRAAFLTETERWDHAIADIDVATKGFDINMTSLIFFIEGLRALAQENLQKVEWFMLQIQDQRMLQKKGLSGMTAYHCCHGQAAFIPYVEPVDQMMAEQLELILRALHTFHSGDQPEAFRLINQAIEIDKKLPYFPAPPLTVKPVHEVYGEMLILAGKPEEAIQQFDLALAKTPNRTRAVIGKYRAYMKLDNASGAAEMKKIIKKNWGDADPDVLAGL